MQKEQGSARQRGHEVEGTAAEADAGTGELGNHTPVPWAEESPGHDGGDGGAPGQGGGAGAQEAGSGGATTEVRQSVCFAACFLGSIACCNECATANPNVMFFFAFML